MNTYRKTSGKEYFVKRLAVLGVFIIVGVIAVWIAFQSTPRISSLAQADDASIQSEEVAGALNVPANGEDMKVAPVYDASGRLVSDPTGTIGSANQLGDVLVPANGEDMKVAPVYDASGNIVSDPTGTIWSATHYLAQIVFAT